MPAEPPPLSAPTAKAYPPIEPFETGRLDVGDGHSLYWELCGNPAGIPAVFLHGGPGSGAGPHHRRLFDPARYKLLVFDQRGAGRSTPHGGLDANTTWHLVADIEALRAMIGADRILLFGGSWGATLALLYAQAHPARVSGLILRGVFTGRQSEIDWFYRDGANRLFPDHWDDFLRPIPLEERGDLVKAYRRRLTHEDRAVRAEAANAWAGWEGQTVSLRSASASGSRSEAASEGTIAFSRIENHYFLHKLWLEDGQILENAHRLAAIPGVIVQGRYDVITPAVTSRALSKRWPTADYRLVEAAGHAFSEPGILAELVAATDRFAQGDG